MQNQEGLKQRRILIKSQLDDKESEVQEIRKRLQVQQKEITIHNKAITALETKLEQKRADRHSLLKSCKVERDIDNVIQKNMVYSLKTLVWEFHIINVELYTLHSAIPE